MMASGARRRPDLRDPRAARRGAQQDEEETSSAGAAIGKALMAMILALVIGAGAAYGYYIVSTPKIPVNNAAPTTTPTTGASTSPHVGALATLSHTSAQVVYVTAGDGQA